MKIPGHPIHRAAKIGNVEVGGSELTVISGPCSVESEAHKGVMRGLIHRGGLRAEILTAGMIRVGDTIAKISV